MFILPGASSPEEKNVADSYVRPIAGTVGMDKLGVKGHKIEREVPLGRLGSTGQSSSLSWPHKVQKQPLTRNGYQSISPMPPYFYSLQRPLGLPGPHSYALILSLAGLIWGKKRYQKLTRRIGG